MTRHASLTLLAALALACRGPALESDTSAAAPVPPIPSPSMPASAVRITLDRDTYPPSGDVKLTLTNASRRNLGYNACTRVVERESNGTWTAVPEPDRVCTMELRLLAGGETVTEQTDLPALPAGRYRLSLRFSDEGGSAGTPVQASSEPFRVR